MFYMYLFWLFHL